MEFYQAKSGIFIPSSAIQFKERRTRKRKRFKPLKIAGFQPPRRGKA